MLEYLINNKNIQEHLKINKFIIKIYTIDGSKNIYLSPKLKMNKFFWFTFISNVHIFS